jgi:hypothetical protein
MSGRIAFAAILVAARALAADWPTYAGGPHRLFFNPHPVPITVETVSRLQVGWRLPSGRPGDGVPRHRDAPPPAPGAHGGGLHPRLGSQPLRAARQGRRADLAVLADDARSGRKLASLPLGVTLAAAPAIVDGIVIVGSGSGSRGPDPSDPAEIEAEQPVDITAFCVAGRRGCPKP